MTKQATHNLQVHLHFLFVMVLLASLLTSPTSQASLFKRFFPLSKQELEKMLKKMKKEDWKSWQNLVHHQRSRWLGVGTALGTGIGLGTYYFHDEIKEILNHRFYQKEVNPTLTLDPKVDPNCTQVDNSKMIPGIQEQFDLKTVDFENDHNFSFVIPKQNQGKVQFHFKIFNGKDFNQLYGKSLSTDTKSVIVAKVGTLVKDTTPSKLMLDDKLLYNISDYFTHPRNKVSVEKSPSLNQYFKQANVMVSSGSDLSNLNTYEPFRNYLVGVFKPEPNLGKAEFNILVDLKQVPPLENQVLLITLYPAGDNFQHTLLVIKSVSLLKHSDLYYLPPFLLNNLAPYFVKSYIQDLAKILGGLK